MKFVRAVLVASIAVGALAWSACVGDDPSTETGGDGGGPGSLDQACFGNGTCNSGLSCVSNVCVDLDGTVGNDSGELDSGSICDAGRVYTVAAKIPCSPPEADCNQGTSKCCAQVVDASCPSPDASCDTSVGADIGCVLPSHCDGTTPACCLSAPSNVGDFVDDTCPRTAIINKASCAASCSSGERQACVSDADCIKGSGMTCHAYQITYNKNILSTPLVIGLCAPN